MLEHCVKGTPAGSTCDATTDYGFVLTDPMGKALTGPTPQNAAIYDVNGGLCGMVSATKKPTQFCPLIAYTTFKASCTGGAATCPAADSITISYTVQQDLVNVPTLAGGATLASAHGEITVPLPLTSGVQTGIKDTLALWQTNTQLTGSNVWKKGNTIGINQPNPDPNLALDVGGPIKAGGVATADVPCPTVGAISYDVGNDLPIYCSGKTTPSKWKAIGNYFTGTVTVQGNWVGTDIYQNMHHFPVQITAVGGVQNPDHRQEHNPCALSAGVNGQGPFITDSDNSQNAARTCGITFTAVPGIVYNIQSQPWNWDTNSTWAGNFTVYEAY
jgi:hypothetical protein